MAYIDVDKFAEKICSFQAIDEDCANKMIWLLRTFPMADAKEVVHAKWEWFDVWEGDEFSPWEMLRCSNCLETEGARENAVYCPNCGAIMDLEDN